MPCFFIAPSCKVRPGWSFVDLVNDETAARDIGYCDLAIAACVTVLICSKVIGPGKVSEVALPFAGTGAFNAATFVS